MAKVPYSIRTGINPRTNGFDLKTTNGLFVRLYEQLREEGYTHEQFGFWCVDMHDVKGKLVDVEFTVLTTLRKPDLWPIADKAPGYSEDDLFDMIEFLFDHVSKPLTGSMHSYDQCGMHWETFDKETGQKEFRKRVNDLLALYEHRFELSADGLILRQAPSGFEQLLDATVPTDDKTITARVKAAVNEYRRHGASLDVRRHAVSDLVGVLEALRPKMSEAITSNDEKDLFNIANNFMIRHHNDKQKTDYEANLWLSWMFYVYLSTIHLILRRVELKKPKRNPGDLVFRERVER
ncbi:hypothetical protein GmRootV118_53970 [Variovorax sp. V118]|uniref:hypothetical protein n=1 Tax=Variovorax sp. V118 TaxID=3065954 RepID=UPI0034E8D603